jgi:hypothetical protein
MPFRFTQRLLHEGSNTYPTNLSDDRRLRSRKTQLHPNHHARKPIEIHSHTDFHACTHNFTDRDIDANDRFPSTGKGGALRGSRG